MTLQPGEGVGVPRTIEDVHAERRRAEPWAQALYDHRRVVFDLSRTKLAGLAAVAVLVAVLGAFLVDEGAIGLASGLGGVVIGAALLVRGVRWLTASRGAVRVDTFGLRIRPRHEMHPWGDIVGATTWQVSGHLLVGLVLADSAAARRFAHRSAVYRLVRRALTWPFGRHVVVLPIALSADRQRLAHWLDTEAAYRNPDLRRRAQSDLECEVSWLPERP
jgi:hypothetical protein